MADKAAAFERQAAEATKVKPKVKPTVVPGQKGGWGTSGNTGGGHTGHEGKFLKKPDEPKKIVYPEGVLPPKRSINDLP